MNEVVSIASNAAITTATAPEAEPVPLTSVRAPGGLRTLGRWSVSALRHPGLLLAGVFLFLLLLASLVPDWLSGVDPLLTSSHEALQAPGSAHWLGTDQNGRDVLARLIHGTGASLFIGLAATAIALIIGIVLGLAAGLGRQWFDNAIMRVVDVVMAFPDLLLALVIIAFWGQGTVTLIIAVGVAGIPRFARMVRAQTQLVRASAYIESATTLGLPRFVVVLRHVLPNAIKPVLILGSISVGNNIGLAAALSFLGFGAPPPAPEWGGMLSIGRSYLINAPALVIAPGVAITLTVLSIAALGKALMRYSEGKPV